MGRHTLVFWGPALAALLSGCPQDPQVTPEPSDDDDATEAPQELPPISEDADWIPARACEVPLSLSTEWPAAETLGLLHVTVLGGSGDATVTLADNNSGAIFDGAVRTYIAGSTTGVTDRIEARDNACYGEASLAIDIVPPLAVRPTEGEVLPGDSFTFEVIGGSGEATFTPSDLRSGGSLEGSGLYVAGETDGLDEARALDARTGVSIVLSMLVAADATLAPAPPRIVMPLDSATPLLVAGGSGWVTITPDVAGRVGIDASVNPPVLTALAPGRAVLTAQDTFTSLSSEVIVDVVATQTAPMPRAGQASFRAFALGPGDIDGDGFNDALLGVMEASYAGYRSGAVYIYAGGPSGLQPAPARVISWPEWYTEMGEDFVVEDLDGDGLLDLAVGMTRADTDRSAQGLPPYEDTGAVAIYSGIPGGFFTDAPTAAVFGQYGSDQTGKAVSACDINGDGAMDLVVGARYAEDRSYSPIRYNAGAVHFYFGDGTGTFSELPDQSVFGVEPDGAGGWMPDASQELGFDLATGDIDGDGLCDVAVGSYDWSSGPGRSRDNLVTVWRGQADDSAGAPVGGGVLPWPVLAIAPVEPEVDQGYFGREVKLADLDGDGLDDLIVGQYRYTDPSLGSLYHGAARVYEGRALGTQPAAGITPASTAIWSHIGTNSYDYVGAQVDVSDADGDGLLDLIIGEVREEGGGSPNDAGGLAVFLGQASAFPETTAAYTMWGTETDGRMGLGLAALGDVDGDGLGDAIGFAGYEDTLGRDVGMPWYFSGLDTTTAPVALDYPGEASGQYFGDGLALVGDVNSDGFDDMVVGAWELTPGPLFKPGAAYLYLGSAGGIATQPSVVLDSFTGLNSWDRAGYRVSRADDFDGDGIDDFAMVARYEDKPNSFAAGFNHSGDCIAGTRNDTGAVYIFRGTAAGQPLLSEPSFVIYGPQTSQRIDRVEGGGDLNGDGLGDILLSGYDWDRSGASNSGGFAAVTGRPYSGAGIDVICTYDTMLLGATTSYKLGYSLAFIGDIDADGCDDFAAGAYLADWTATNEGAAHIVKGWGGAGCPAEPLQAILTPRDSNDQAGIGMGGGGDIDGDGIPDLVVGAPYYYANSASRGSAWVVPGSWMVQLPYVPLDPDGVALTWPLWPLVESDKEDWRIPGEAIDGRFGWDVSIVPGYADGRGVAAVGAPRADLGGDAWTGGAQLFAWEPSGGPGRMSDTPVALVVGEPERDSWLGGTLHGGTLNGAPALVLGAYRSDAQGVDQGAAYVVELSP